MNELFHSRLGEQLYRILPEVYRTRDRQPQPGGGGDLAHYLDAHGRILDLIHATLAQQLKDALPDTSQEWLLPYFAQLLAVNIISPDIDGKRAEISQAVSWRQRKGTLACAEQIAQAVGEMEVELQEAWRRLAMTPRVGMPLVPENAAMMDSELVPAIDMQYPPDLARHPALPVAMVDLRDCSRAVQSDARNPAARTSDFRGVRRAWRQVNVHGAPCFPDSFEDVSRRTVDLRTVAGPGRGLYHPKRLLAFAAPPCGLFPFEPLHASWDEALQKGYIGTSTANGVTTYVNVTARRLLISDDVPLASTMRYRIEGIDFSGSLLVEDGGALELRQVEAKRISVTTPSTDEPVLTAVHGLFETLSVGAGLAKVDSCTVLGTAYLRSLQARDCIFMEIAGTDITGSIEYSRIPEHAPLSPDRSKLDIENYHRDAGGNLIIDSTPVHDDPQFISGQSALAAEAVLSPKAPESIRSGASDGGEMGYFHGGREGRPVRMDKAVSFSLTADDDYPLADVLFSKTVTVTSGCLHLCRSAAKEIVIETDVRRNDNGEIIPSLDAVDCLFGALSYSGTGNANKGGLVRLEYCTVLATAQCRFLQASDCILAGDITGVGKVPNTDKGSVPPALNCVRYSAIPYALLDQAIRERLHLQEGRTNTNTWLPPLFQTFQFCPATNGNDLRLARFGEAGCGVLSLQAADAIRFGAEDGGEMGAGHHRYYSLKAKAVLEKMSEFLPLGIEPVLWYDTRLLCMPPVWSESKADQ